MLSISGSVDIAAELFNAALVGKGVSNNSAFDDATVSKVVAELKRPISMQLEFQGNICPKQTNIAFKSI